MADTPLSTGYLEGQVGWLQRRGPYARVETGLRLSVGSLFGFGQWTPAESMAGLGYRREFDL